MRERKFRAWDNIEKRFGYVSLHPQHISWMSPKYSQTELLKEIDGDIAGVFFENTEEWQEFTGLKDKTGKEIYEGDFLRSAYDWFGENITGTIEVEIPGIFYSLENDSSHPFDTEKECEVIGNVYENPGLLKGD